MNTQGVVPLQSVPSQTVALTLAGQQCQINVYQKTTGLFFDLIIDGVDKVKGRICRNKALLVDAAYLGVTGDFLFYDTQGSSDPDYTGLADRYALVFVGDVAA